MTSTDEAGKRAGVAKRVPDDSGSHATRTIPSLDVEEIRKQYEHVLKTGRHPRAGTVHLGPEMLKEETDARVPVRVASLALESESGEGATVDRESVLKAAPPRAETTPTPTGPRSSLDLLVAALDQETLSDEPPPYLPARIGERFDGMMRGGTLEMKVDPPWDAGTDEKTPQDDVSEVDLPWLAVEDPRCQELANSYGLSDEDVSRAFAEALPLEEVPDGDALIALGRLARIEARIVDRFAALGRAYRDLVAVCAKPESGRLRARVEKLGLLSDADLREVLRHWIEDKHPSSFFADDDGRRLKQVRLVGAYLVRKKGEALCRLELPGRQVPGSLAVITQEIQAVKQAFEERQRIIQRHFGGKKGVFATSFLVQRGPNAMPGFFWSDETCLESW